MGFLGLIGGLISAAVSVVGAVIATVADVLINKLPPALELASMVIGAISTVVSKVNEAFGLAPANENVEELGAKALQQDTRAKMDDETTQEYLDYLRNDVEFDEEKFAEMSEQEKIECEVLGTSMLAKSIEEKTGVELSPDFLLTISKSKMRYEQVEKFIRAFSDNGISSMGEFTRYISNDMSEEAAGKVGNVIEGAIREMSPELSDLEIQKEIVAMKQEYFSRNDY